MITLREGTQTAPQAKGPPGGGTCPAHHTPGAAGPRRSPAACGASFPRDRGGSGARPTPQSPRNVTLLCISKSVTEIPESKLLFLNKHLRMCAMLDDLPSGRRPDEAKRQSSIQARAARSPGLAWEPRGRRDTEREAVAFRRKRGNRRPVTPCGTSDGSLQQPGRPALTRTRQGAPHAREPLPDAGPGPPSRGTTSPGLTWASWLMEPSRRREPAEAAHTPQREPAEAALLHTGRSS